VSSVRKDGREGKSRRELIQDIVANETARFLATTHRNGAAAALFLSCPINYIDRAGGSFTLEYVLFFRRRGGF
jgi:hypothetical protein